MLVGHGRDRVEVVLGGRLVVVTCWHRHLAVVAEVWVLQVEVVREHLC